VEILDNEAKAVGLSIALACSLLVLGILLGPMPGLSRALEPKRRRRQREKLGG
jgi:hypothetical protein